MAKSPATLDWSADVSNPPTIPAIADIRNTSLYTGAFTADVLANAPAGGEGGGLTDEQAAQLAAIKTQTDTLVASIWSYAVRTLTGSNLSRGPTAQRSRTVGRYECFQGSTEAICRLILGWDGEPLRQADVSSITYSIYELSDDDPPKRTVVVGHENVTLDKTAVLFDEVRSDELASDYNFKHVPEISENDAFATAGTNCFVEYTITPTSGEKWIERIKVEVT